LPSASHSAILNKYPGSTIELIEKVEKPGKLYFEVLIKTNGKKKEIGVNTDGSFVK